MSIPQEAGTTPIEGVRELVDYVAQGCKPKAEWRIGTEHEKFGFYADTLKPLRYETIRAVLEGLAAKGWERVEEEGALIGLKRNGASVSLEPGGQFELSGAPLETIHQTCDEVHTHLADVRDVADPLGVGFLGIGAAPTWTRADMPWMPKGRYAIMRRYMEQVGAMGHDMMLRTCTIQTNLDFDSEADMVLKARVALALQPMATALFANSPFLEGAPNGFMSWRAHVWSDTDPDRTGMLPFVFEDGFGFERWIDYALDVPMYFVARDGRYIDVAGRSFRDFMDGRLPELEGERPTLSDWADHLTTIFPEIRIKRFIEVRGADGGPWGRICGLPALWVGLLYDSDSLTAAWDIAKDWTMEEREALRLDAAKHGLQATIRGRSLLDVAREAIALARAGLARRGFAGQASKDETEFLASLEQVVESGESPAQCVLNAWRDEWGERFEPLFKRLAY